MISLTPVPINKPANQSKPVVKPAPVKPLPISVYAQRIAKEHNIPKGIFFALIRQESGWNHRARSRVGAVGLTQVMPYNVRAMGYKFSRFKSSPVAQLHAGADYLQRMFKTFKRWDFALAAYNAGPGAVKKYHGIPPYRETIRYVRNILRMAKN